MNKDEFILYTKQLNINIDEETYAKFNIYYELLVKWNDMFNLTNIIKKEEVFLRHFYDSLCLIKSFDYNNPTKLCDFGTGAGFPGVVIAIIFSNINVTLLESNKKKCLFLEEVKKTLSLTNITVINARVEEYSKNNREIFDIVTCRAVSSLPILLEISASLIKEKGYFLPLKSNIEKELKLSSKILLKLGLKYIKTIEYYLPIDDAYRTIPVFNKISKTCTNYPRNYNLIVKTYKKI